MLKTLDMSDGAWEDESVELRTDPVSAEGVQHRARPEMMQLGLRLQEVTPSEVKPRFAVSDDTASLRLH